MTEKSVESNLQQIKEKIADACRRVGRDVSSVQLMAVTKTVKPERVNEVLGAGVSLIGENRVQEYLSKREDYLPCEMHFIGHLQTNKIKDILPFTGCIQSVDSMRLLKAIAKEAEKRQKRMDLLLEWNVGEEESKTGADRDCICQMLEEAACLPWVRVRGLMVVPPPCEPEESRVYFQKTAALFEELKETPAGEGMDTLSMGMSHDFVVAIEEGATIVRVGSALFGERHYQ